MTANHFDNLYHRLQLQKIVVRNPWSCAIVGELPVDSLSQLREKLAIALASRPALPPARREQILHRAGTLLERNRAAIVALISSESGLSFRDANHEVDLAHFSLSHAAREAWTGNTAEVIAAIASFHHPFNQVMQRIAPAIASNNCVVLKASEKTPLSAQALRSILIEAKMPSAMLQLVNCSVPLFVEYMATHPWIDKVHFSGSTTAGLEIASHVPVSKLVLNTEGNGAMVVCADADLKFTAALAARGSFAYAGQCGNAVRRILVDRRCHEIFVRYLITEAQSYRTGDPLDPAVTLGTVIDEVGAAEIEQRITISVAQGATCVYGNHRHGASLSATILTGVTADMPLVTTENFGPVAAIMLFSDIAEAIRLLNETPTRNASVFTHNSVLAARFVNELKTSKVTINQHHDFA